MKRVVGYDARPYWQMTVLACLASAALGCSSAAGARIIGCHPFVRPDLNLALGGASDVTVDLDCNGIMDTVVIDRVADGPDRGLPEVIVSLNGHRRIRALMTDGLPKIVDAGDLDGDGIVDLLLANADESISIWPMVVLVTRDSLIMPRGSDRLGVYHFDPISNPDCDYRTLLPTLQRRPAGRLSISWIDTSVPSAAPQAGCRNLPRAHWQVVAGELRRQ